MRIQSTSAVGANYNTGRMFNNATKSNESKPSEKDTSDKSGEVIDGRAVTLELSVQGGSVKKADMSDEAYIEMLKQQAENSKGSAEGAQIQARCMIIAGRIAGGDKVPIKDEKYLMEHDIKMYTKAMQMRIPKPEPKEWDSIIKDEEEKGIGAQTGGSEESGGIIASGDSGGLIEAAASVEVSAPEVIT